MKRSIVAVIALVLSTPAWAGCSIFNDTNENFTVESGNVSNHRLGSHTHDSINAGTIIAKADSGKSVGGSCNDGDRIKIVLEQGVLVIKPD